MEHVPWVEVQEGRDVVETVNGEEGNNDQTRDSSIAPEETIKEGFTGREGDLVLNGRSSESSVHKITGQDEEIQLDETEDHEREDVSVLCALRSVSESEDELKDEEGDVYVFDQDVDNRRGCIAKRPTMVSRENLGRSDELHDDGRGEVERRE